MRDSLIRSVRWARESFLAFSVGQKMAAILGTFVLLVGGFLVYRWASAPDYSPLYSELSAGDASAVVDQLDTDGTPYQLADGGSTVLVPKSKVYATRIALSGKGLPGDSDNQGYSLLDDQGMSLSQEQQDVNFKRAMEGELTKTIEAIDGVEVAVVHLAMPAKEVFSEQQQPTTASVLVKTRPGATLSAEQVQAVVNLVASSVDGLDPDQVTVADATGKVLAAPGGVAGDGSTQTQMVDDVQNEYRDKLQTMLDRVLGPGNSTVQVTADLDFDDATTTTTDYTTDPDAQALSSSSSSETFSGPGGSASSSGVVGPDGQLAGSSTTGGATGDSSYEKKSNTQDNAVDKSTETRVSSPGSLDGLHVGVAVDNNVTKGGAISVGALRKLVVATAGLDQTRGDTVSISEMTFNRAPEAAAAKELAAASAAAKQSHAWELYRNIGLGGLIALAVLLAFLSSRRRAKRQQQTTTYLVDQIRAEHVRQDQLRVAVPMHELPPAALALEEADPSSRQLRREIDQLIEQQPDDVAALLRGWLAERP